VPSRSKAGIAGALAAAAVIAVLCAPAFGQSTATTVPTEAQITKATADVKADPNFATERKMNTLHWSGDTHRRDRFPGWLKWLSTLFAYIGQSARVLMWVAIAIAAGLIAIYIMRLLSRVDGLSGRDGKFVAPSHVQDLDIRPESLPPDIGAAVRALWDRGEHRAALALLYRALLSRLVHVYEVPIRDSSTEGDCLVLAARHVDEERTRYATRLVKVWQLAVYGGETVDTETVYALCDGFGPTLDRAPDAELGAARGAPA
jgi:Domain of unknown function (DUF4129)